MQSSVPQFYAIVEEIEVGVNGKKTGRVRKPYRISLDGVVSKELSVTFEAMSRTFFDDNPNVYPFDMRFNPGRGEMFSLENVHLSPDLIKAIKNPLSCPPLDLRSLKHPQIKAICMATVNSPVRVMFQQFATDQIIRPGYVLIMRLFQGELTYRDLDTSGLSIGNDLDAVYDNGTLYFRSYYTTNRFLDLTQYFEDASDDNIKQIFSSAPLYTENIEKVLENADSVVRKKLSILEKSQILDDFTPVQIRAALEEKGFDITIVKTPKGEDMIEFPTEKKAAKELLDLLTQSVFVGIITGTKYLTNSYRAIETERAQAVSLVPLKKASNTKKPPKPPAKKAAKKNSKKSSGT